MSTLTLKVKEDHKMSHHGRLGVKHHALRHHMIEIDQFESYNVQLPNSYCNFLHQNESKSK